MTAPLHRICILSKVKPLGCWWGNQPAAASPEFNWTLLIVSRPKLFKADTIVGFPAVEDEMRFLPTDLMILVLDFGGIKEHRSLVATSNTLKNALGDLAANENGLVWKLESRNRWTKAVKHLIIPGRI